MSSKWNYSTEAERKSITVNDVMSLNPCDRYTREYVQELFGKRKRVTALGVLSAPISLDDKAWLLSEAGLVSDAAWALWACDCAQHVQRIWRSRYPKDSRPQDAIDAQRLYIRGEIEAAARAAAWAAAWAAAGAAARDAARAAARDAEWAAAWAAARAAARVAAWAAARVAARDAKRDAAWAAKRDAEQEWQLERLREYIKQGVENVTPLLVSEDA